MAYPTGPRWSITLYYNTVDEWDTLKKVTLWIQHTHPEPEAELDSTEYLGGFIDSVGQYRNKYSLALEPFEFPHMMTDYAALWTLLKGNRFFWLETITGTDTYSMHIDRVQVSLTGFSVTHADDTGEKMVTLDFKDSNID